MRARQCSSGFDPEPLPKRVRGHGQHREAQPPPRDAEHVDHRANSILECAPMFRSLILLPSLLLSCCKSNETRRPPRKPPVGAEVGSAETGSAPPPAKPPADAAAGAQFAPGGDPISR